MIELYGMQSPNVRKVGIILEELELDYELRHVAVFRGDQFEADFRKLNPLSKVPVVVDHDRGGGKPLFESGAILFYLAETYGAFLPEEGMARYEVMSWLMAQMALMGPMGGQLNHFQILGEQIDSYALTRYRHQCERLYAQLDERLTDRDWIAGNDYSIADIATYPWALYLEQHGFDPEAHPALVQWRNRIGDRPAISRSWARFAGAFDEESNATRRAASREQLERFFGVAPDAPEVDFSFITKL